MPIMKTDLSADIAADRLAVTEARLLSDRETSDLREQFTAVLGHDLRWPRSPPAREC
jgi:hypothetical protein